MKKIKCDVCGYKFLPVKENVYQTKMSNGLFERSTIFDTIDCPKCGCQSTLQVRYDNADQIEPEKHK